jgi:hypothetical protein
VRSSFDERVINTGDDVLVEVYSPHCRACKALTPRVALARSILAGVDKLQVAFLVSCGAVAVAVAVAVCAIAGAIAGTAACITAAVWNRCATGL